VEFLGANERLRSKLDNLRRGKPVKVVFLGGSITAGAGAGNGTHPWTTYLTNWMEDQYGQQLVSFHNAAVPATTTAYMAVSHSCHMPPDGDIIFVEVRRPAGTAAAAASTGSCYAASSCCCAP
jgi:hypothetical protein